MDPAIAAQQCCRYNSHTVSPPGKCEKIVHTTGFKSNTVGKSKQSSNEAEKEERKLRRILANRESALQTIRRRQAMYLELTRKAADLSVENENLKKEKELALAQYNSLKDRNKHLNAKMVKIKKAELGDAQGEPMATPHTEKTSTPATTNYPMFLCNQPSLVPCFWPSSLPSSDVHQLHYASHPDVMGSSQYMVPHKETSHQRQENPMGMFVLPVCFMLPFLPQTSMFHDNDRQKETSTTQQCGNNTCSTSETPLDQILRTEAMFSASEHGARFTFPPDSRDLHTGCDTGSLGIHANAFISATSDHITRRSSLNKNREPLMCPKKPEDVIAAAEARMRRKELMKMKNILSHKINMRGDFSNS